LCVIINLKHFKMKNWVKILSYPVIKLLKGFIVLFAVKLFFLTGITVFNSCQKEHEFLDNTKQEEALHRYENFVVKSALNIQEFVENSNHKTVVEKERGAEDILIPLTDETKKMLLAFGINNSDLSEEFDDLNDPRIITVGLAILAGNHSDNYAQNLNFDLFYSTIYANEYWDCAVRALGISGAGLAALAKGQLTKEAIKMAVRVAARSVGGYIAAAFIVADFTSCMGWW